MPSVDAVAGRAALAERAVTQRHLRRCWTPPFGRLGVITHPAPLRHRLFVDYHYWWQAHLLDCLIDAELRSPSATRRRTIAALPETVRWRNKGTLINDYYDDVAWMALAMQRAVSELGIDTGWRRWQIGQHLHDAWRTDGPGAGIPWRRRDEFRNVPANGSAAILLARFGRLRWAREALDWMFRDLLEPDTGLIREGWRPDGIDGRFFTYNQGLVLGAELELVCAGADPARLHRLVRTIRDHAAVGDVINGVGGGDGGLFHAITARYLAQVALRLPGDDAEASESRAVAARLVRTSADAAWRHRAESTSGPFFGPDWTRPAIVPDARGVATQGGLESTPPERDLSVQLGGWMVLELAAALDREGCPRPSLG